jgi:hypothetical protein
MVELCKAVAVPARTLRICCVALRDCIRLNQPHILRANELRAKGAFNLLSWPSLSRLDATIRLDGGSQDGLALAREGRSFAALTTVLEPERMDLGDAMGLS